jgi:hypothetical protein
MGCDNTTTMGCSTRETNKQTRQVLCDIFIQWGIPMNIGSENEMCLNESSSKVRLGRYLPDTFLIQNGLKQCGTLMTLLRSLALEDAIKKVFSLYQRCEKVG